MRAIETTDCFQHSTTGTEYIRKFTDVVQKANVALVKYAINNPRFDTTPDGKFNEPVVRLGILYGDEAYSSNNSADDDDQEVVIGDHADAGEMVDQISSILFEGQRRYGRHPLDCRNTHLEEIVDTSEQVNLRLNRRDIYSRITMG